VPARSAPVVPGVADVGSLRAAAELLAGAMSPAVVAGDGVGRDGAVDALVALAETLGATVHHQPLHDGLDFPYPHPLHAGVLPTTNAGVRDALRGHDVVLIAGCHAFNPHHWTDADPIPTGTRVIQLDDDPAEPGRNFPAAVALLGGIGVTLSALTTELMGGHRPDPAAVLRRTRQAARRAGEQAAGLTAALREAGGRGTASRLDPFAAAHAIVRGLPTQAIVVEEAITSGVLLRKLLRLDRPGSFLHTVGGGLGHGIGMAVGAALGSPGRPVVCVLGDGCTLFGLQGLWSASRLNVPVTFVVMNNGEYRTLKETLDGWSSSAHGVDGRYPGLDLDPPAMDFRAAATAFDLRSVRVTSPAELTEAVAKSAALEGPQLVEVPITGHATGVAAD
jgi:benzoylformate decarboxylase